MSRVVQALTAILVLASSGAVWADIITSPTGKSLASRAVIKTSRGIDVEETLRNNQSPFLVRIDVCRLDENAQEVDPCRDRVFQEGECVGIKVRSEKSGFLYLFYKQADGSEKCLFPNQFHQDNQIQANTEIVVPLKEWNFDLRVQQPFGDEILIALVSTTPLSTQALGGKSLTKSVVTAIDLDTIIRKGIGVELRNAPDTWAEHHVTLKTVARTATKPPTPQRLRLGLYIGISDYKDADIRDLHVCHTDAQVMAAAMKERGRLDGLGVLVNEHATRANIQAAIQELKLKSKPGDELFIYWSGHGGTCADTDGDEKDGLDEFLVPYDAVPGKIAETMVLDDEFGRWIQDLDGRRVVVILDACHSGGSCQGAKGLKSTEAVQSATDSPAPSPAGEKVNALVKRVQGGGASPDDGGWKSFLDDEFSRVKDIGQDDAAMLFSSAADEISAERRDGDLSVMTYFLVEMILRREAVTIRNAFDYVKVEVPRYMQEHFRGRTQTPQLFGTGADVRLR